MNVSSSEFWRFHVHQNFIHLSTLKFQLKLKSRSNKRNIRMNLSYDRAYVLSRIECTCQDNCYPYLLPQLSSLASLDLSVLILSSSWRKLLRLRDSFQLALIPKHNSRSSSSVTWFDFSHPRINSRRDLSWNLPLLNDSSLNPFFVSQFCFLIGESIDENLVSTCSIDFSFFLSRHALGCIIMLKNLSVEEKIDLWAQFRLKRTHEQISIVGR